MKNWFVALGCAALLALLAPSLGLAQDKGQAPEKVLRYAFRIAETGFDPAQVSDVYSTIVLHGLFDALYSYDYLARPAKVRPNVAAALPDVSADFRVWTIKIKPGVYFSDDPAFGGKKRELVAQDFVYTYKRIFDPKLKSPHHSDLEQEGILGLAQLRADSEKPGGKFDYDSEIAGLRALDRYTLQIRLERSRPRFIYSLADPGHYGAVAREVVERYGDKIMEHPVGTGPFVLQQWTRSSKMVLARSPSFRDEYYEAEPPADDARSQEIYRRLKGKKLPLLDRVEVSIIDEDQPRWLAFLGGEYDFLERLANAYANQAIPNNRVAPNLAKKGITMERILAADIVVHYFNMEDPVVGGYTPEKVALRRAVALAYNAAEEIRLPRRNQAAPAQGVIDPGLFGYDPSFKSEMSEFNREKAMALLDMYGYVDNDGDGWRDLPDGKPLVLEYATQPDATNKELNEIWKRSMNAIGVKIIFKLAKWPEQMKASRAGKLMMWGLGYSATTPDGGGALEMGYGPQKGQNNLARFANSEYDRLHEKQSLMPDGPERQKTMQEAVKILVAYMPYKVSAHRYHTDLMHPWVIGYRRHPVSHGFWKYVDIDTSLLPKK